MTLASYASHDWTTIDSLYISLVCFDKLKWVLSEQKLRHNREEMGHLNIPKLHSLTHYATWTKEMGTFNSVNTSQIEALHKIIKEAYQNSNKVDYVA
jgi:hypothetical protein